MSDDNIDDLTRQLERLRLRREEALRTIDNANRAETDIIARIRRARANNPTRRENSHRQGDIVRITNVLRNEHGIVGTVLPPSGPRSRLITIQNQSTSRKYTRGWWNLELVHSAPLPNNPTSVPIRTTRTTNSQ